MFHERNVALAIKDWGAEGVIGKFFDKRMEQMLKVAGLPFVNTSDEAPVLPAVKTDTSVIASLAARYFLDRGIRSLGYCSPQGTCAESIGRHFCEVARMSGASCDSISIDDMRSWLDDQERIVRWVRGLPKPAGIMTPFDYCGRNLILLCRHVGVRVPEDVAIMGTGNDDTECSLSTPALSSVITPGRQIGYEAAALLDGMLRGRRRSLSRLILLPALGIAERQSTNITRISDPDVAAAVEFIAAHAGDAISLVDVLKAVPLSRSALDKRFRQALGRTPKAEIIRTRIQMARSLLSLPGNHDAKLTQIASKLGFSTYSRFRKLFERETGTPPAEYWRRFSRGRN
jgi:LacI family transcriptional regulator